MAPDKQLIHDAGQILLSLSPALQEQLLAGFKKNVPQNFDFKKDITTEVDHSIGKYISKQILSRFPDIAIDSEETSERSGKGDYTLRIDPLDGTKHMVLHIDICACLISLSYKNETVFGMIVEPFSKKTYWAFKGEGAFLNDKKISVSDLTLGEGVVMCEPPSSTLFKQNPGQFDINMNIVKQLQRFSHRTRNFGLISLGMAYVAQGAMCACVDLAGTTKLYDCEAGLLIAREAGAKIATINNTEISAIEYNLATEKKIITDYLIIANPSAFDEIIAVITNKI